MYVAAVANSMPMPMAIHNHVMCACLWMCKLQLLPCCYDRRWFPLLTAYGWATTQRHPCLAYLATEWALCGERSCVSSRWVLCLYTHSQSHIDLLFIDNQVLGYWKAWSKKVNWWGHMDFRTMAPHLWVAVYFYCTISWCIVMFNCKSSWF